MQKIGLMGLLGGVAALGLLVLLVALPALAEPAWVSGEVRLNLRSGAGNQYRILGALKTGDSVQVLERGEKWTKIRTAAGEDGWIPGGYLNPQPPPTIRLEELEVEVERGGRSVIETIQVSDLHAITPSEFLEFGDGISSGSGWRSEQIAFLDRYFDRRG